MKFGGAMFFTEYSMSAMELARALEERGFESVWAPEHSHIPLSRKTPFPGGGDLPKQYYTLTVMSVFKGSGREIPSAVMFRLPSVMQAGAVEGGN
jgi:alkanesulfonate monooxygenase SsuD/methylene tetrahydromethanopterin reductase-like flavin-dependent oxidoreductase (luciferase family)